MADRVAVMMDGRILQLDTPESVYARPARPEGGTFHRLADDLDPAGASRSASVARLPPSRHRARGWTGSLCGGRRACTTLAHRALRPEERDSAATRRSGGTSATHRDAWAARVVHREQLGATSICTVPDALAAERTGSTVRATSTRRSGIGWATRSGASSSRGGRALFDADGRALERVASPDRDDRDGEQRRSAADAPAARSIASARPAPRSAAAHAGPARERCVAGEARATGLVLAAPAVALMVPSAHRSRRRASRSASPTTASAATRSPGSDSTTTRRCSRDARTGRCSRPPSATSRSSCRCRSGSGSAAALRVPSVGRFGGSTKRSISCPS